MKLRLLAPFLLLLLTTPALAQAGAYPGSGPAPAQGGGSDNMVYEVIELKYIDPAALAILLGGTVISIEPMARMGYGFRPMQQPLYAPRGYGYAYQPYGRGFYTPPPDPFSPRFGRPGYGLFGGGSWYGSTGSSYGLSLGLGFGG